MTRHPRIILRDRGRLWGGRLTCLMLCLASSTLVGASLDPRIAFSTHQSRAILAGMAALVAAWCWWYAFGFSRRGIVVRDDQLIVRNPTHCLRAPVSEVELVTVGQFCTLLGTSTYGVVVKVAGHPAVRIDALGGHRLARVEQSADAVRAALGWPCISYRSS